MNINISAANPANERITYSQGIRLRRGPIRLAPSERPRFEIAMYSVNCVAATRFQHNPIPVANVATVKNT